MLFRSGSSQAYNWQFKFEPVVEPISEVTGRAELRLPQGTVRYYFLENSGDATEVSLGNNQSFYFTGFYRDSSTESAYPLPPLNESPSATNEWDWFSFDADTQYTMSFDNGPEFSITAVTEQQAEGFNLARLYRKIGRAHV